MNIRICVAFLAVFLGLSLGNIPAYADSPMNSLFPWLFGPPDKGPKPEETLQAPFGNDHVSDDQSEDARSLMKIYDEDIEENTNGLDKPHRSAEQVGEWAAGIVTQALTIDPEKFGQTSVRYKSAFTDYAWQEYQNYLNTTKTLESLGKAHTRLTAFAENKPVLVREDKLENVYRWVFQVPVMLTFYDANTQSLKAGQQKRAETQRATINVQIGRAPTGKMVEGMMIERWTVNLQ